ncbi:MAG: hypothetical protein QXW36_04995 [Desulfurococcaceae archaeon]
MKLYKLKIIFLSHSFLPVSSIREHWTITHTHIPPSTLSGLFLRAVLYAVNPKNMVGDYVPCEIGEGLLLKLERMSAKWFIAGREEVVNGAKPPYLEYHFKAVSLGAYDEATLLGIPSQWGFIEKYWNTLKYIDAEKRHLEAPFHVGIKTWFYALQDGTTITLPNKKRERYMTYDIVKVRFDIPLSHLYGFILVNDARLESVVELLIDGWFIDKSRLKTLVSVKLDDVLVPVKVNGMSGKLFVIPSIKRPRQAAKTFVSSIVSKEALMGRRHDTSVEKCFLHVENPKDIDFRNSNKLFFKGRDGTLYAVDKSWLEYLELDRR